MQKNSAIKSYQLKSGKTRYKFQTYLGTKANGQRISVTRQGFKTYYDALHELNHMRAQGLSKYSNKQIKMNDLFDLWFENYKTTVKESSANKVLQIYRNHVQPEFGNQYMNKISLPALQKYADAKAKEIVKYKNAIRQISILYEYAIRLGYARINPIKRILIPKRTSRPRRDVEHNVYSKKELEAFLKAASKEPINIYTYFMILANTGLRRSEALALEWKDIDFKKKLLHVNKTLAVGFENQQLVQPPKSKHSYRSIPISASLLRVLKKYRQKQTIKSDKLFATKKDDYLRISKPNSWLTSIYHQNPQLRKITLHGFRHTFATLLAENTSIKPKTLQMLMGHENIQITFDIYTHINVKNQDDAINAIKNLNL